MRKSLGNAFLLALEKSVDGYVRFEDFANNPHKYAYSEGTHPLRKPSLSQAIKRLRKKGFVEGMEDDKNELEIIIKLTDLGRDYLLTSKLEEEVEWDGKWRLVMFDIPETKKTLRNVLRRRLKIWDFKPWQKSVWVSKKNITEKLRNLVKELGIQEWVLVIESDNVGR